MNSILEEFARGNLSPETRTFNRDSHYGRTMQKLTDKEEKLYNVLNESEREIFKDFLDAQMEADDLSEIDKFIYGYRLGVLMTMEVFNSMDYL